MDLGGEPMLSRVVNRTLRAETIDQVVVATTVRPTDNAVERLCHKHGWSVFKGDEDDVLDRYYHAALAYKADVVVRLTSDCPLIDPEIVNRVVQEFLNLQAEVDYACNILPHRSFPRGLDTEVIRFDALERAWLEDKNPEWREHVTPYIRQNPDLFHIHGVMNDMDYSHMRWTVDTTEDLAFAKRVYHYFGHDRFSWREVLPLLEGHPEILEINRHVLQKELT